MRSPEEIISLYSARSSPMEIAFSRMRRIRDVYNSDIAVPLPELGRDEQVAVANLAQQGLDQYGQRIGSVLGVIEYQSEKPGVQKHDDMARTKKQVAYSYWERSRKKLARRRAARWYCAYGTAPEMHVWDKKGFPRADLKDPLGTYPAPSTDFDEVWPDDCIFRFSWTSRRLRQDYPDAWWALSKRDREAHDAVYTILSYVDAEQITLIALGGANDLWTPETVTSQTRHVVLEHLPNLAGCPLAVTPGRITLDRPMGQFDGMVGMYLQEAEFMALATIAARKSIFPDLWLVANGTGNPQIIKAANGLRREIGKVTNGTITVVQPQPGYLTMPTMDRLRENQQLTSGVVGDMIGDPDSRLRTGRRAGQFVSSVVDFPIQEAQEVFDEADKCGLMIDAYLDKAYSPDRPRTISVAWKGARGKVTYNPKTLWEDCTVIVDHQFAGTDTNGIIVEGGQRLGMKTLSPQSFMDIDPLVKDTEMEMDRIEAWSAREAFRASVQTWANDPNTDPLLVGRYTELVETDRMSPFKALAKVKQEAQEAQAQQVAPGSPEAMPGLMANPQPIESIPQPPPDMSNLSSLLMNLRGQQRESPAEAASVTG